MLDLTSLFDEKLGSKLRAAVATFFGIVTALTLFLQSVLGVLDALPGWKWVGAVAMLIQGILSGLANFTKLGNKTVRGTPLNP